jgi:hypothetical protein
VVQQAIEERDRLGVLRQETTPGFERPVGSDAEAASLIGRGHEAEQELGSRVVERGE